MSPSDPHRSALVVIDMQNDFLAPGGAFPRRHCEPAQLIAAVAAAVVVARQQGRTIVWVRSIYGEHDGEPATLRGLTHTGAPCCARGSWGAEPVAALAASLAPDDPIVTKRWYSGFRDTDLRHRLADAEISKIILCGVATNVCVLATARDARQLGLAVDVLTDATAAGTHTKHLAALREMTGLGARARSWGDLPGDGPTPVKISGLGAGETTLWAGALRDVIADPTYEALADEVEWHVMWHRGGEVPRRVAVQGTRSPDGAEPLYRHPVDGQPTLVAFTPIVDEIRRAVERHVGHPLNHCLLQLYRDGHDWIGEHADKTLDLARPSSIVNVSLGRMRTMILRSKRTADGEAREAQRIPLPHGSFLVMDLATNQRWFHEIRPELADGPGGPRISLTFRHIGSFWDPSTGAVWGVGAPSEARDQAEALAQAHAALPSDERAHRERDEAVRMLQLFRDENQDPDFDPASYRPGFAVPDLRTLRDLP